MHYYTEAIPELIEKLLTGNQISSFVDLGCGDGALIHALAQKGYLNKLQKVVAVDICPQRIEQVRSIDQKILAISADACRLDMLSSASQDLVVANQLIEHLSDQEKFLKEAHRILKDQGRFYLSTVFKKKYAWYFYRAQGKWALDPTHLREYTVPDQLINIIRNCNWQVLENKKTMHWFALTDFIFKRMGMRRDIYQNKVAKFFRRIKIPIFGYYNWELILKKAAKEDERKN